MPYFDHNATTPLSPAARQVWLSAQEDHWHNPSSLYRSSARVRNALEDARLRCAEVLACPAERIVFNSGATEGANALFAFFASAQPKAPVLLSGIEHPCGMAAAHRFFRDRTLFAAVDAQGRVAIADFAEQLKRTRPALVSLMAANNETGVLQPWLEAAEICHELGIPFHCDASQWLGKAPAASFDRCNFVTASAHKFGGPKGSGLLIVSERHAFTGQVGGEQERGVRGGTEDFPSIAAAVAALDEMDRRVRDQAEVKQRAAWKERFETTILRAIPSTRVAGSGAPRLWNTSLLLLPTGVNERWVRKFDRRGFAVSTGSACSSAKETPSHVLAAMGCAPAEGRRSVRVSSGWQTTEADWEALAVAFTEVFDEIRQEPSGDGLTEVIRFSGN